MTSLANAIADLASDDTDTNRRAFYRALLSEDVWVLPGVTSIHFEPAMMVFSYPDSDPKITLNRMPGREFIELAFAKRCGFSIAHSLPNREPPGVYISRDSVADILAESSTT